MVVANFTAPWCGPCRAITPFSSELSKKYPELVFLVVNVDELAELCSIWDILVTPTFYFLKDGEQLDKMIGSKQPELEQKAIDSMKLVINEPNPSSSGGMPNINGFRAGILNRANWTQEEHACPRRCRTVGAVMMANHASASQT
ncbi:hypothetical protein HPP92_022590 [Vanilla planifolia]|uniref:Thioredoxin domain-containing protein n=1 Tax=Vanilla planifolia TaxID=51239 RepID=A0A835Q0W5_VANPL|nr:hypothetical protein HPP92_022590 [Vanilla planifolia]